ncbi:substrate-binding domain-containing protein [Prolixibacter sp. SD074]|jgi:D-xylose transport system substrate-binding protein|uniref:substrate-binding domain-containing protein n=1 Tax=Prolixibacter sp. SD074 TaxID=2652391 RepID=UPI0012786AF3|nr:substrate-binding domain-containing protein [Prolixibacter sp. SD074]GET30838.1 D-xylose ABC transporter substrate-binding protein [Prolixibacter sp. SD074]
MKSTLRYFILFIGLILAGCSSDKVKVGLLIHSLDKERWENDQKYFIESVNELGGKVLVAVADNDEQKQIQQAQDLLKRKIQALVVIPVNQYSAASIVDLAHNRSVPVISYDRLINNSRVDYYVSTDNIKIGEMQARYMMNRVPEGNYALIGGSEYDNNSRMLYLGQINILQPYIERGDIFLVYRKFSKFWSEDEGYQMATECLDQNNNQVDAIIAGNDAIAYGVLRVLKERGLEKKIAVAGMDADLRNVREIVKGNQSMTVYKPIKTMASTAAQISVKLIRGEKIEDCNSRVSNGSWLVPSVLLDALPVYKDNIRQTVIAEGYLTEKEIYQ